MRIPVQESYSDANISRTSLQEQKNGNFALGAKKFSWYFELLLQPPKLKAKLINRLSLNLGDMDVTQGGQGWLLFLSKVLIIIVQRGLMLIGSG
jgi:hypothetical protein